MTLSEILWVPVAALALWLAVVGSRSQPAKNGQAVQVFPFAPAQRSRERRVGEPAGKARLAAIALLPEVEAVLKSGDKGQ